jgi:hypothetical protein
MDWLRARPAYRRLLTPGAAAQHELESLSSPNNVADTKGDVRQADLLIEESVPNPIVEDGIVKPKSTFWNRTRSKFPGFRTGGLLAAGLALFTLIANLIAFIFLKTHPSDDTNLVELYVGNCSTVENLQMFSHLLINILGTMLLSGSNYCMQVMCAPTRADVQRAHRKDRHLNVGVQSPRNLFSITWWRTAIWFVLSLSSVPLHLMYNSSFYSSIAAMDYDYMVVGPGPEPYANINRETSNTGREHLLTLLDLPESSSRIERLDPAACLDAYAREYMTVRSNLIIVAKDATYNGTADAFQESPGQDSFTYEPFSW